MKTTIKTLLQKNSIIFFKKAEHRNFKIQPLNEKTFKNDKKVALQ